VLSVASQGVRLAAEVTGDGEPVTVVAHGLTGNRTQLAGLAPMIPGTKVLFDFRGHGESDRPPPGAYSMDDFAADVDRVAADFGATRAIGVSLGGGALLRLLSSQPDRFERIVVGLPARLREAGEGRSRLLRLADLLEAHPVDEVAEMMLREEEERGAFDGFAWSKEVRRTALLSMNRDGIPAAIRGCIDDPPVRDRQALSAVRAPVLVFGQEGDPVHDAGVARGLAAVLPNAELLMYESPEALVADLVGLVSRIAEFLRS
jgi:pimeloyl-ACP methyl ester carboxylesterase